MPDFGTKLLNFVKKIHVTVLATVASQVYLVI